MDQDRFIPIPQLEVQCTMYNIQNSKALWDFGTCPERKGDGLLFEKEVQEIQVGKGSKC